MKKWTAEEMRQRNYDCYPHSSFEDAARAMNRLEHEADCERRGASVWPSFAETNAKIKAHLRELDEGHLRSVLLDTPEEYR